MLKKIILCFVLLSFVFVSCSQLSAPSQQNSEVTAKAGMSYLGDVNKIYSANKGRFYTGQIIENFYGRKVKFEGNLVEYNIIKPEILAYVEGLKKNNALMHQHYEGVKYNKDKKYVEFSSYTEVSTGKILMFEIRVFFGNFLDTFNQDYWYAKSVSFNPSFTKDLNNNKPVNFGTPLGNPEDDIDIVNTGNTNQGTAEDLKEDKIINIIGDVDKVYSSYSTGRWATGQKIDWKGKKVRFQGNMVKYKTVKKEVLDLFTDVELNAMMNQGYTDLEFEYENEKIYIEVCSYRDIETKEVVKYNLRLIDKSYFDKTWSEWYAKSVSCDQTFFDNLK